MNPTGAVSKVNNDFENLNVKSTTKNLSNQSTGLGPERTTYCSLWTETIPTDTEKSKVSRPTSKEEVDSRWRQAIRKTLRLLKAQPEKRFHCLPRWRTMRLLI
jgi:hypothetical protein